MTMMTVQKGMDGIAPDLDVAEMQAIRRTDQALKSLERGRKILLAAKDDFERIQIRDEFRRMQVASQILNLKDISIAAAELVADAEREIAKANPAMSRQESGAQKGVKSKLTPFSRQTLSDIRRAHSQTDEEYAAAKERARARGEPITRQSLLDGVTRAASERRKAERAADLAAKAAAGARLPDAERLTTFACGIADLANYVPAGSVDAIITDPPDARDAIGLYRELADFAVHALRPGGGLYVWTSQLYLPEVMDQLRVDGLQYRWQLAYFLPNGGRKYDGRKVTSGWKPILVFTRGGAGPDKYGMDVVPAQSDPKRRDEFLREWGQDGAPFAQMLEEFVNPGSVVCDPFCGSGATLSVARAMGYACIAADISADEVARAKTALTDAVFSGPPATGNSAAADADLWDFVAEGATTADQLDDERVSDVSKQRAETANAPKGQSDAASGPSGAQPQRLNGSSRKPGRGTGTAPFQSSSPLGDSPNRQQSEPSTPPASNAVKALNASAAPEKPRKPRTRKGKVNRAGPEQHESSRILGS
ncbi:MAG: DNA methyltransferase [Deltaproteobacteria bacterium]|nr:DNA methyltransferase [Deltaproteobacteria bacterium]